MPKGFDITDTVEIVEGGLRKANDYLAHGYLLLSVARETKWKESPAKNGSFGLVSFVVYSLARPADVEQWAPPPKPEQPAKEEGK